VTHDATQSGFSEDTLLGGRVRLRQPVAGYRVAIDPVLLAASIPAQAGDSKDIRAVDDKSFAERQDNLIVQLGYGKEAPAAVAK